MFSAEPGAMAMIEASMEKYSRHFEQEFPLYVYLRVTQNEKYNFSIEGALRLADVVDRAIVENVAVYVPEGYHDRLY